MNAEELYDAFAQIDDDLLDGAAGTVLRVRTINPRRIVAAAIALFVVGAGVAFYLIRGGRDNGPGIDGVIQSDYPREGSAVDGEIPLLTAETYDEYVIFLHTNECAKQIVKYDLLMDFGDFKSFVVTSGGYNGEYSQYCYSFVDLYGFEALLMITDTSKIEKTNDYPRIEKAASFDLRSLGSDLRGVLRVGKAEYMYVNGNLLWIEWKIGNLRFKLTGNPFLSEYPKQAKDTIISGLLDEKTAAARIAEISDKIANGMEK